MPPAIARYALSPSSGPLNESVELLGTRTDSQDGMGVALSWGPRSAPVIAITASAMNLRLGPTPVISSPASDSWFPTNMLAMRRDTGSSAPHTGTPYPW